MGHKKHHRQSIDVTVFKPEEVYYTDVEEKWMSNRRCLK